MPSKSWTISANGNGAWTELALHQDKPVYGYLVVSGANFGGGTLTFDAREAGSATTAPVEGISFTSSNSGPMDAHPGVEYRPVLTGATAPSAITVTWVYR